MVTPSGDTALSPDRSGVPGTALITGASSGVGLFAAKALVDRGWHVVMACRDTDKARRAQAALGMADGAVTHLKVDLADLDSVRALVDALNKAKPSGAKGTYIKKISLSSTMGPGFRIDTSSVSA
jgi:protochlorophyllide reductase